MSSTSTALSCRAAQAAGVVLMGHSRPSARPTPIGTAGSMNFDTLASVAAAAALSPVPHACTKPSRAATGAGAGRKRGSGRSSSPTTAAGSVRGNRCGGGVKGGSPASVSLLAPLQLDHRGLVVGGTGGPKGVPTLPVGVKTEHGTLFVGLWVHPLHCSSPRRALDCYTAQL